MGLLENKVALITGAGGAPPAAVHAVADALSPFGVTITRLPLGPSQIAALLEPQP